MVKEVSRRDSMSTQSEDSKKQWGITGVAIPAGLFIGLGVGFMIGNIPAGIFLGLGGGFFIMMIGMLVLRIREKSPR